MGFRPQSILQIKKIELPDLHVCRFTPSGQYLVRNPLCNNISLSLTRQTSVPVKFA